MGLIEYEYLQDIKALANKTTSCIRMFKFASSMSEKEDLGKENVCTSNDLPWSDIICGGVF